MSGAKIKAYGMAFEFPGEAEIIEGMVLRVDKTEQFLKVCLVESKINKTIRNELGEREKNFICK